MSLPTVPSRAVLILPAAAAVQPIARAGQMTAGFFRVDSPIPLSDHAPNIWTIARVLPGVGALPLGGLAMAAAVGVAATLAARWISRPPLPRQNTDAALLVALALPGLLPGMSCADFVPACLLGLALSVMAPGDSNRRIAALVVAGTSLAITNNGALAVLGSCAMIAATALVARQFLVSPANDNGLPLNPFRVYPA